jgi:hypothetical protein
MRLGEDEGASDELLAAVPIARTDHDLRVIREGVREPSHGAGVRVLAGR